jgi:urea transporter
MKIASCVLGFAKAMNLAPWAGGRYVSSHNARFNSPVDTAASLGPTLARPSAVALAATAMVSTVIAVAILGAVTALFQSRGLPMEELAAAERACSEHVYVSERETCMRTWLSAAHGERIAHK